MLYRHYVQQGFGVETALDKLRGSPIFTSAEADAMGVSRSSLAHWVKMGKLEKLRRGLYCWPDRDISEHSGIAEAVKAAPSAVVCLLTALRLHEIGTQQPFQVWLAIEPKGRVPAIDCPPIRAIRLSEHLRDFGIDTIEIEGVPVRVTSIERTLVECFKFRSKIGLDVAMEALVEAQRSKRIDHGKLWAYAGRLRMQRVMMPYLEMASFN
ncbi:type IV toxin-antitoxin system AbiEi family antitoxin domain-containing protein [Ferrimonas lipolytica]|uniref:Transcriptional regulator n=1 Tax=Ferrimonas lipolytica TaxID=2724191 RepID=A0A6H1U9N7_9GAMM|nr:AbiEi antitoxin N-terminal domain-containing protein [Ferrimonas lipolytica]QIZ75757.1 transcriptional regulator [Ferrimonas lipolytica]